MYYIYFILECKVNSSYDRKYNSHILYAMMDSIDLNYTRARARACMHAHAQTYIKLN